jgi:hypothetical protein
MGMDERPPGKKNDLTDEEALDFLRQTEDLIRRLETITIPNVDELSDADDIS